MSVILILINELFEENNRKHLTTSENNISGLLTRIVIAVHLRGHLLTTIFEVHVRKICHTPTTIH